MRQQRWRLPLVLVVALGAAPLPVPARAGPGIAVIVSRDAPRRVLDRVTLSDIYLKKIFVDGAGNALIPVNLPPDDPLRRAFSLSLLGQTSDQLQGYWNERYFHGVRPPYVLGSPNAVIRFVAGTDGAIGYVAACQVDARVRALMVLPVPPSEREAVERLCAETARRDD
jgi:ABC-type phosphate transport system substrate-binding protein